ncbi:YceH family protein [Pedobacter frigiditerrae]|uniref:YceH family protein n=1 Tax=Pedobacter frigiditerrae TaxID=2530452 RepID=UPI00292EC028|nr:YceH family protein [Pedobacter frigiditerrae]
MDTNKPLPILDAAQIRVLGALMEKSKTTPDYYPMTLNGLAAACNQKTSRKPVVQYDESTITTALNSLKIAGLISTATGGSIRNIKYKHNFAIVFPVLPSEVAVMCLLFLRGPQTPGEINTNSGRLYEFETLEEVQQVLEKLASDEPAYIKQLPRKPGQKEQRYMHLFAGDIETFEEEYIVEESPKNNNELEERLTKVEEELAELKTNFDKLMKELMG